MLSSPPPPVMLPSPFHPTPRRPLATKPPPQPSPYEFLADQMLSSPAPAVMLASPFDRSPRRSMATKRSPKSAAAKPTATAAPRKAPRLKLDTSETLYDLTPQEVSTMSKPRDG